VKAKEGAATVKWYWNGATIEERRAATMEEQVNEAATDA